MSAGVDQILNDHMTRIQMRLANQKLNTERDRYVTSRASTRNLDDNGSDRRLHDALSRRKTLLDKIAEEKKLQRDLRPVSDLDWNVRSPSPGRRSLPPILTDKHFPYKPGPGWQYPQYPVPHPAQHPGYGAQYPFEYPRVNPKQEMIEMMMMQNAQMHQMMMNHMMMTSLPKNDSKDLVPLSVATELFGAKLNRPPSVHHHHYDGGSSSPLAQYKPLPAIPSLPKYQRPVIQSQEVQPLLPPPVVRQRKRKLPFPGPDPLRKFRHVGYAALFCEVLKQRNNSYRKTPVRTENSFYFRIRIKEIVAALHKIYLNPEEKIKPLISRLIYDESVDLAHVLEDRNSKPKQEAISNLSTIVEEFVFRITEIMPSSGILGTHRKSAVYALIQPGQNFPSGYFWNIEKAVLDEQNNKLKSVDDPSAFVLLSGMYIGRCLVSTLLLKPLEYDLFEKGSNRRAEKNLKVLATILIYVLRKAFVKSRDKPLGMPYELSSDLYSDELMSSAYSKLKRSVDYCVQLLKDWAKEYTKRLRNV